jgi:hypothetical protein
VETKTGIVLMRKKLAVINEQGSCIAIKEVNRMGQSKDCIYSGNQNRNCFNDKRFVVINDKRFVVINEQGSFIVMKEASRKGSK